jgi:hypothetical protein
MASRIIGSSNRSSSGGQEPESQQGSHSADRSLKPIRFIFRMIDDQIREFNPWPDSRQLTFGELSFIVSSKFDSKGVRHERNFS